MSAPTEQLYCCTFCADEGEACEDCLVTRLRHEAWHHITGRWTGKVAPDAPNPFDHYDATTRTRALTRGRDRALYRLYLRSDAWRERRRPIIARAGGACEDCGRSFLVCLDVHHLTYEHLGDEPDEDLRALCRPCHDEADLVRKEAAA